MDSSVSFTSSFEQEPRRQFSRRRVRGNKSSIPEEQTIPTSGLCDILRVRPFDPNKFMLRCQTHPQDALYKCGNMKWSPLHRLVCIGSLAFTNETEPEQNVAAAVDSSRVSEAQNSFQSLLTLVQKLLEVTDNRAASEIDLWNRTPLFYAVEWCASTEVIFQILIAYPEACMLRDQNGITPIIRQWDKYCGVTEWYKGKNRDTIIQDAWAWVNDRHYDLKVEIDVGPFSSSLEEKYKILYYRRMSFGLKQFHSEDDGWNKIMLMILQAANSKIYQGRSSKTTNSQDSTKCFCPYCCSWYTSFSLLESVFLIYEHCPLEIAEIILTYYPFPMAALTPRGEAEIPSEELTNTSLLHTFLDGLCRRRIVFQEVSGSALGYVPTWATCYSESPMPSILKLLLSRLPVLARIVNDVGDLPLHKCLVDTPSSFTWDGEIMDLVDAFPAGVAMPHNATGLVSFALAAAGHSTKAKKNVNSIPEQNDSLYRVKPLQMEVDRNSLSQFLIFMSTLEQKSDISPNLVSNAENVQQEAQLDLEKLQIIYKLLLFDPNCASLVIQGL